MPHVVHRVSRSDRRGARHGLSRFPARPPRARRPVPRSGVAARAASGGDSAGPARARGERDGVDSLEWCVAARVHGALPLGAEGARVLHPAEEAAYSRAIRARRRAPGRRTRSALAPRVFWHDVLLEWGGRRGSREGPRDAAKPRRRAQDRGPRRGAARILGRDSRLVSARLRARRGDTMSEGSDYTKPADPVYRQIFGNAESLAGIDEVIATARQTIRVFDISLTNRGFNSPARATQLREFFVRGRAHRLLIALHETELLERECPRLLVLLRQFPMSIEIHRTIAQARNATDPCVIADDHSVWHQLHFEQPRAVLALHSVTDALPIRQRFDEIWDLSEPAVSATTLGL